MANNPVFDPEKALGSGLGKLTRDELLSLVKSLCEIAVAQSDENRFRGGFRPGNINFSADGVTVGPADKAVEDGWTKDELEFMAPEVFWNGGKARAPMSTLSVLSSLSVSTAAMCRLSRWQTTILHPRSEPTLCVPE